MQLVAEEKFLNLTINKEIWREKKVDGKFLLEIKDADDLKQKLNVIMPNEKRLIMDFIKRNQPMAKIRFEESSNGSVGSGDV